ncbi:hypothetical protein A5768_07515 [Mycolicibacterium fortuitum]|uniref:hypothetical protein n=1 Tax=Mycolicibacterium fortuitum TaxID=1766 RepID=UPI0007E99DEA|nr:hypothetical protein [Mycolicibacterium fortuitum]OBG15217.1 hypothetical protein A5768_07515 [Mycolicibacterium fortuitum]
MSLTTGTVDASFTEVRQLLEAAADIPTLSDDDLASLRAQWLTLASLEVPHALRKLVGVPLDPRVGPGQIPLEYFEIFDFLADAISMVEGLATPFAPVLHSAPPDAADDQLLRVLNQASDCRLRVHQLQRELNDQVDVSEFREISKWR